MKQLVTCWALAAATLLVAGPVSAQEETFETTRWHAYQKKAAVALKRLETVAATPFGGEGNEEFIGAGVQPDGTVVAVGNLWGPEVPEAADTVVLGKGEWHDVSPWVGAYERTPEGDLAPLAENFPNIAGAFVFYAPDLAKVKRLVRFDWTVAKLFAGKVAPDGSLIVTGRSTGNFGSVEDGAGFAKRVPKGDDRRWFGAIYYERVKMPGDVFVAKLSPDAADVEWVWVFEGHRVISEPHLAADGSVVVETHGLKRVAPDGRSIEDVEWQDAPGRRVGLLAVDAEGKRFVRGGDRLTHPKYHQPLAYGFGPGGAWTWQAYPWSGNLVVQDNYRLVGDSFLRDAAWAPNGELVLVGVSDGADSVFGRSPLDIELAAAREETTGLQFSVEPGTESRKRRRNRRRGRQPTWLSHVVRMDPATRKVTNYFAWSAYGIDADALRSADVDQVLPLDDGSVAIRGTAETCLVYTPDAWFKLPNDPNAQREFDYHGDYVTVLGPEFETIRFSSYVPACRLRGLAASRGKLLVVGRVGTDQDVFGPTDAPTKNPAQRSYGGGRYDAQLIMMKLP